MNESANDLQAAAVMEETFTQRRMARAITNRDSTEIRQSAETKAMIADLHRRRFWLRGQAC
jgi:hypothetical protein